MKNEMEDQNKAIKEQKEIIKNITRDMEESSVKNAERSQLIGSVNNTLTSDIAELNQSLQTMNTSKSSFTLSPNRKITTMT